MDEAQVRLERVRGQGRTEDGNELPTFNEHGVPNGDNINQNTETAGHTVTCHG